MLLAMFAIAFLTLGGSYMLFYAAREGGVWGTTNEGAFVDPPMTVAELNLTGSDGLPLTEGGTWWLWVVSEQDCLGECATAVHQLRQLHILLNKDADRVQRALVTRSGAEPGLLGEYPALEHLTGALAPLSEGIYIVDPIGNLVLFYPLEDAGKPVLTDLKKLLKLSQIG
jgi:cytochrome oxidase Cu insertion factor (SCO1/SenC/PrrC family)